MRAWTPGQQPTRRLVLLHQAELHRRNENAGCIPVRSVSAVEVRGTRGLAASWGESHPVFALSPPLRKAQLVCLLALLSVSHCVTAEVSEAAREKVCRE